MCAAGCVDLAARVDDLPGLRWCALPLAALVENLNHEVAVAGADRLAQGRPKHLAKMVDRQVALLHIEVPRDDRFEFNERSYLVNLIEVYSNVGQRPQFPNLGHLQPRTQTVGPPAALRLFVTEDGVVAHPRANEVGAMVVDPFRRFASGFALLEPAVEQLVIRVLLAKRADMVGPEQRALSAGSDRIAQLCLELNVVHAQCRPTPETALSVRNSKIQARHTFAAADAHPQVLFVAAAAPAYPCPAVALQHRISTLGQSHSQLRFVPRLDAQLFGSQEL